MVSDKTRKLTVTALFAALTLVMTFICVPGPRGGFIHFGNVPFFIGCFLMGGRRGALSGAVGMSLYDVISGYFLWAPFTFVIRIAMGFIIGKIAGKNEAKSLAKNALAILAASAVMIGGYYISEIIIYGNALSPLLSIPGNIGQLIIGAALSLPLTPALKKAIGKKAI